MAGGATSEAFTYALEHSSFLASVHAYGVPLAATLVQWSNEI